MATQVGAQQPVPSQPILVIQDATSTDPYQNFVPELLLTEGLNGFQVAQLSQLTSTFLANYDAVILPHSALSASQVSLLQNYVNTGGVLVGFRPDLQLAGVFGVTSLASTLPEGWLQINSGSSYAFGLATQVLKFHGTADLYSLNGAASLATLYRDSAHATSSPAAATNSFGQGRAILFSFDLAQSIVLMRQGNPAWAGYPNNHDGNSTMRASQMFMDAGSGSYWNDSGDGALNDIPQADEQLRLFSNALVLSTSAKRPLPRLWYFPNQKRAVMLMTGDQHGDAESNSVSEASFIQSYGGLFSDFLWYPYGSISNSTVTGWLGSGHAVGIHFDDTGETDSSGVGGSKATWNGMQNVIANAMSSFAATFPAAPTPVTTRDHFLIWVSNNSSGVPDQTAQAKLFQNAGIQLDTSFAAFPNRWGYMNGSGLPMKFLDSQTGAVIPVYEQSTQYEDDIQLGSSGYSLNWDFATAQSHYQRSLSDSSKKYNTVVTTLFHPDHWSSYQSYAQTALQYAQSQSIIMPSTTQWLAFWKGRAATGISMPSFVSNTSSFSAQGSPAGLTLLVPDLSSGNVVSGLTVDGVAQTFSVATYQGIPYASVVLGAGTHSISVAYGAGASTGRILGQVSPAAAAAVTTVQVQVGSSTQSVQPAADGTFAIGPFPPGTYTVTPVSSAYSFSPQSQSVTLGSADVTDENFAGATSGGGGGGETLFTTQTPVLTNVSDGVGVNYEQGTVFTSGVAGNITAIRFWKASNETGTHIGHVWSGSGQLMASVTFANETPSGWQQQVLATPLPISASSQYVVSVNTGNTWYVASNQLFASQINSQDLSSVVGNNGVYGPPGQFPTNSYQNTSYFRDVVFTPGGSGGETLFTNQTPALPNVSDGPVNYEQGMAFSIGVNGAINAIRFWKASNETGTHTGHLWTANGQLLASVAFTNETASGWQQQSLTTPIPISANAQYIVSVNTGNTWYAATSQGLASQITNQDLSSAVGSNGVYGPPGLFPTNTYSNANYFRDVVFAPGGPGGETLFPTQRPVLQNLSDGAGVNYEQGTVFTSGIAGTIAAIRFWKASNETGTHIGRLWTAGGQLLASVTFTNETASGWQQQSLSTPVAIAANSQYVVSVNTGNTYYVATSHGLASQVANLDLSTIVGNNGVYGPPGQFPSNSFQNANYFRDVVFLPGGTAGQFLFTRHRPILVNMSDGAGVNYEQGTVFMTDVAGSISAIRFWKSSNETGTHTGHIWSASGQLLASVTFSGETAAGWQQQSLATPLAVAANTEYVVSVNTGNTYYVATSQGLASQITNLDLSSVVGNNGVYGPPGQFPTNSYNSANYFRDIGFNPNP